MQADTQDQIEVTLSTGATKSMKEAAINLIRSYGEEFTMDQFVDEMSQIDTVTDSEAAERYRNNQAMQYRRMFGAFKAKSNRQIQESKQEKFAFLLPLDDGGIIEIDENTVISFRLAEKRHLNEHRRINAEKRAAKIAILEAADKCEAEQIGYATSRMDDGDKLGDYDDGNGNAIL
jgi:uncharacterized membrane protein